jgi:type I restriction enzyme S subunit
MSFPKYSKYKDSGVEWLGDVPEHWNVVSVKRRMLLRTEKTARRQNPVGLENIESWTGRFVPTETEFEGDGVEFETGDILFGKLRPYLAKVHLADGPGEAVGDFHVMRPHEEFVGRFAQYCLLCREFIAIVDGSTFGSKMPRASWEFVSTMKTPVPPFHEQTLIADFLDRETSKIDSLVAEQRRLIELLKEKRQAVISHAVTKGLNPHAPMKPSGIEWLGDVPEHWAVTPLAHLCDCISYGFTNPMPTIDEGPYLLTANDIDYGKVNYECARRTTYQAFRADLTEKSRPKLNDILLTKDGTLGRVAIHGGQEA